MHPEAAANANRRRRECFIDIAALELAAHQHIGARFFVQQRSVGARGLFRVADDGQGMVINENAIGGVFRLISA